MVDTLWMNYAVCLRSEGLRDMQKIIIKVKITILKVKILKVRARDVKRGNRRSHISGDQILKIRRAIVYLRYFSLYSYFAYYLHINSVEGQKTKSLQQN
jgi:hypothetical protein